MNKLVTLILALSLGATAAWARGGGGCFEQGTLILTPGGEVPIEQLRIGDAVVGGRVEAIFCVQPDEYLEIGNGVHVTAEHPFEIAPGVFRMADRVFPTARHVTTQRRAYNLLVSPTGTYIAGGFVVHNKGCFLPDTPILRADGTQIAIRNVRPGDELLAFTPDGVVVRTTVRNILTHEVEEYLEVATERTLLRVTVEHPFYVGDGTFKTLEALNVGDSVYAYDGQGLSAQKIISIAHVHARTRVYNLQTDAPNTFFANSIAVHNKGGGGGGFGGGGFGGHGRGGYSSQNPLDPYVAWIMLGFIVVVVIYHTYSLWGGNREDENLDFVYSPAAVEAKAAKTRKLLEFISKIDSTVNEQALQQLATDTFVKLQQCWQAREYSPMQPLLMPDLYAEHCSELQGLCRNHEINMIEFLHVERVDIVNIRYTQKESGREFTALITARAQDYYVDDRDKHFLRGDEDPSQFQEFWTFHWQGGAWLLREIEQSRESDKLKEENFFEQFTDKGVQQVYGKTAGQEGPSGPWLEKSVETKATRIERLLNFLVQTDKLWDQQAMVERARQVFTNVMLAREAGDPTAVHDDELFPATALDLRQQIDKQRSAGLSVEYRNLCIRKAELILVRNYADNSKDEYTVRISAHAQKIIKRNGAVVSQDEYVTPFLEYWTFGRLDNQWKLKEVEPPATGEAMVGQENVDEDSNAAQLQWYYQHTRAT
jgi:predicted lipid-binding transport protein (Tim44 family)